MSNPYGFDLGDKTSYICSPRGSWAVVDNEASNRANPTLISFTPEERFCGEGALTQAVSNYKNTIYGFKRLVGRTFAETEQERQHLSPAFDISEGPHGTIQINVAYGPEGSSTFSPEQLLGTYLSKLKSVAEMHGRPTCKDVVLAVPMWFTEAQRQAYLDAAVIAGLSVGCLITEHHALALAWGFFRRSELPEEGSPPVNIVLVDMGHTSLQAALVSLCKTGGSVKAVACDPFLGGRDFDKLLAEHFIEEWETKYKLDIRSNKRAQVRIEAACEKLKILLSAGPQAPINIESLMNDVDVKGMMQREEFLKLAAPLLDRIVPVLDRLKAQAPDIRIDDVVVAGGSMRVPAVQMMIQQYFQRELSFTLNLSEAVCKGCAVMAAKVSPTLQTPPFDVKDIQYYPVSLSWESFSDETRSLVPNSQVAFDFGAPSTPRKVAIYQTGPFTLTSHYSSAMNAPVPTSSPDLRRFHVSGVPVSTESNKVTLKFTIDSSGFFVVTNAELSQYLPDETPASPDAGAPPAPTPMETTETPEATPAEAPSEEPTKKKRKVKKSELSVDVIPAYGMSREQLDDAIGKEHAMRAADQLVWETAEALNQLESYIFDMRQKLNENLATHATTADKDHLLGLLAEAEDWLGRGGHDSGEPYTKADYKEKLAGLKKLGDPIEHRASEFEQRPHAIRAFNSTLSGCRARGVAAEVHEVAELCSEAERWLMDMTEQQGAIPFTSDPVLRTSELRSKADELYRRCEDLVHKAEAAKAAKRKAEEEAAKKAAEEAEAARKAAEAAEAAPAAAAATAEQPAAGSGSDERVPMDV